MAVIELPKTLDDANVKYYYDTGSEVESNVVGIESGKGRLVRYTFISPVEGAISVSMKFYCSGDRQGDHDVPLRFYIGTDPVSHIHGGVNSEYLGELTKSKDAGGAIFTGEADILLLPNTTYYLWVFPGADAKNYYGYYWWSRSGAVNTLTLSGGAGLAYIDGEAYQAYIGNGTTYELFLPYVGNGSAFDLLSG